MDNLQPKKSPRSDDIDEDKFERFVVRVCLIVLACVFIYTFTR